jgi:hypothetical protein
MLVHTKKKDWLWQYHLAAGLLQMENPAGLVRRILAAQIVATDID